MKNNHTLMGIATIGTFGVLYVLLFKEIPKDNVTVLLAIGGPLLGFYFGSSVNKQPAPVNSDVDAFVAAAKQATNTLKGGTQ